MAQRFANFASRAAAITGSYVVFIVALVIVVVWAISGPLFGFSDTWQLAINTGTTIATFLMVFLIQNTQNRDATALHLKLDEIIHSIAEADDAMIGAEEETEAHLAELKKHYHELLQEHNDLRAKIGEPALDSKAVSRADE